MDEPPELRRIRHMLVEGMTLEQAIFELATCRHEAMRANLEEGAWKDDTYVCPCKFWFTPRTANTDQTMRDFHVAVDVHSRRIRALARDLYLLDGHLMLKPASQGG